MADLGSGPKSARKRKLMQLPPLDEPSGAPSHPPSEPSLEPERKKQKINDNGNKGKEQASSRSVPPSSSSSSACSTLALGKPSSPQFPSKPNNLSNNNRPDNIDNLLKKKKRSAAEPVVAPLKSRDEAHKIIVAYHNLVKKKQKLEEKNDVEGAKEAEKEMEAIGGIRMYQEASIFDYNTRKKRPDGWIAAQGEHCKHFKRPIRLFDVGSLRNYFAQYNWLKVTAIDLEARAPTVQQMDFFDYPIDKTTKASFDVIVLGLVINFVPTAEKRGEMLRRCRYLLVDNGLLFVTIPRACVVESRCITHEQFLERLNALGFVPYPHDLPEVFAPKGTGKVAFYQMQKRQDVGFCDANSNYNGPYFTGKQFKKGGVDFGVQLGVPSAGED